MRATLLLALTLLLPTSASAAYPDVILADNPLAYWRLEETSGDVPISQGSLEIKAKYNDKYELGFDGLVGTGYAAEITTGSIEVGSASRLNKGGPFSRRSLEIWFRPNRVRGRQVLITEGDTKRGLAIYLDGSQLYVVGYNTEDDDGRRRSAPWGTPVPAYVVASTTIQVDKVYHAVLVMEGTSGSLGSLTGYLNGVSFGRTSGIGYLYDHAEVTIADTKNGTRFHDNNTSKENRSFAGLIDEVAVYGTALTATQVLTHYQAAGLNQGARVTKWVETR